MVWSILRCIERNSVINDIWYITFCSSRITEHKTQHKEIAPQIFSLLIWNPFSWLVIIIIFFFRNFIHKKCSICLYWLITVMLNYTYLTMSDTCTNIDYHQFIGYNLVQFLYHLNKPYFPNCYGLLVELLINL